MRIYDIQEEGTLTRTKSTRSRNCDKNPPGDEDQQPASLKNLSKVGGMLKNSPVGQGSSMFMGAVDKITDLRVIM